ncbi:DUF6115 domain-containing protein [Garciella nitratireducens]|uniref:Uncharacterized protein n=1 Tax=Garciella nitratireducens DSM 15102 TaxID=1121911 RepID=A0A1T4LD27_9FIRM|nr:hypothetical protein [Garciella nitratireducens]SJZ52457.1 hypothetical protein SAMN02745973_00896 [Garciella nitratireducens DSM 15102]
MLYFLLFLGILLIFYGKRSIKRKEEVSGEAFQEILLEEQGKDRKALLINYELKTQLLTIQDHLEWLISKIEDLEEEIKEIKQEKRRIMEGNEKTIEKVSHKKSKSNDEQAQIMEKILKLTKEDKSIEEIASILHIGKGEVLFIQNLLKK